MQDIKIKWLDQPQKHDYPAARSYLSLTMDDDTADRVAKALENAPMTEYAAKDIFRSSGLSLLGVSDSHVAIDHAHIIRKEKLSPLLLYRDRPTGRLIVADGYHRLCAVYKFDENAMIPCKIV